MSGFNKICISRVAATIEKLLSVKEHAGAAEPIDEVINKALDVFDGNCDRVFMYNPDAIGEWVYEKYRDKFEPMEEFTDLSLEMLSVMPSVTPACFGTMYSGMMPEVHGIQAYVKPVLKVETVFDALPASSKKCAIVSTANDSISMIFLERNVDYFVYKTKEECNKKALELIEKNVYDLIVLYNGDYDHYMHRVSPDGKRALKALSENVSTYCEIYDAIKKNWKGKNTVLAFAPDHGCHRFYKLLGQHGLNVPSDMNIRHFYSFIGK